MTKPASLSRRDFVQAAAATSAVIGAAPMILGDTKKGSGKTFKVGLIGCGGRGRGAASLLVEGAPLLGLNAKIVAVADYFKDRAVNAGKMFNVPEAYCFGGPTGYQDLLATDVEIVLNVTAPLFRPLHVEAAVKAGKHVFVEKPVAVDPPGCRRVIAAGEEAKKKGLVIVTGTEQRHGFAFRNTHQSLIVEKALGKLLSGRVSFSIGSMFATRPINPKKAEDLVRTWQNWLRLSGDHIVEQHVHNIDIANWYCGGPPVSAVGFGGRAQRCAGDMYDFFSVDFDYGNNVHVHSMCRQVNNCWNWVGHDFLFEKGRSNCIDHPKPEKSPIPADLPQGKSDHHQEEIDILYHVNKGKPLDDIRALAESTAAAIMGRHSTYTGKQVFWEDMMVNPTKKPELYNLTLRPTAEDFEKGTVQIPVENVVPIPGKV